MIHKVTHKKVESDWFEALPLGNGKFGCMAYYKEHSLILTLNHYDIYYEAVDKKKEWGTSTYYEDKIRLKKLSTHQRIKEAYQQTIRPKKKETEPLYSLKKTPETGYLQIDFHKTVQLHELSLLIEEAMIELTVVQNQQLFTIQLFIREFEDTLIFHSDKNLMNVLEGISIQFNQGMTDYVYQQTGKQEGVVKKKDTDYLFIQADAPIQLDTSGQIHLTSTSTLHLLNFSLFQAPQQGVDWSKVLHEHKQFWAEWWQTTISIPDKFLETIWHLYLYLIKASSGIGSRHYKQGPGLNGLWDAKNESLWGSMWYWDVNIQSIFWSAFSSNHLELAKQFCDAYLAHETDIRAYTKAYYNKEGWAIDYPHHFYNCIQPWCAQFLFWYYEYTNDKSFLRKALRVFHAQCTFILETYTESEDGLFFPDISPEQGPLTADSTVTLSSVRYLFEITIQTLHLLGEAPNSSYQQFLDKLPSYAVTTGKEPRLMDSPYTKENQWLRHPSLLMPIFPIKDKDYIKGGILEQVAKNSVNYAFDNCETGMFGSTWIASAYAQLGEGDKAIQTLYEKGLDLYCHSNGLPYEESERWINLALITKPPIHLPAMMEPTGGLTNTINDLLLQKHQNRLDLLPALPAGHITSEKHSTNSSGMWSTCSFSNLLVQGGHQVSLSLVNNTICWLKIIGGSSEKIQVSIPSYITTSFEAELSTLQLEKGTVIEFGKKEREEASIRYPLQRLTHNDRTLFLGKNEETRFHKLIESMTRPYVMGNTSIYPMTVYKFDFGDVYHKKEYASLFHQQVNLSTPVELLVTGYRSIGNKEIFSDNQIYGFSHSNMKVVKSQTANLLQQDCLISSEKNTFKVTMPAGKYTLLIGLGGAVPSKTQIQINQEKQTFILEADQFDYWEYPFVHSGGAASIHLATEENASWAINFLMINKERLFY